MWRRDDLQYDGTFRQVPGVFLGLRVVEKSHRIFDVMASTEG